MVIRDSNAPATRHHASGGRVWAGLCAALALACALAWVADPAHNWAWQPVPWPQQIPLLRSAALAQADGVQMAASVIALVVLALLGLWLEAGARAAAAVLLAWPLGMAALAFWPSITSYSGLSGLACSMWAILGVHASLHSRMRWQGVALLTMLAAKLLADQAWSRPLGYDPNWGTNVLYAAHLSGALTGAGCAVVLRWGASKTPADAPATPG